MKQVAQKEGMGCGLACVASVVGKSYKETKKLFTNPQFSSTRGFYGSELVEALKKRG